jgi:hypothetical protein
MPDKIPPFVTSVMLWDKLNEVNRKLDLVISGQVEQEMRELTLNQVRKLFKIGEAKIIAEINSGRLKARIYEDKKGKTRYRFSSKHIKEYKQMLEQEAEESALSINIEKEAIPTPADIWKQVSGSGIRKNKKAAIN